MTAVSPVTQPLVDARGLGVGYSGRPVVEGVDLALAPGELVTLVGTNGSGKSTLLKTIVGLLAPVAGSVEVRGRLAYMGQAHRQSSVLPLRVRDVVGMGRYAELGLLGRWKGEDRRLVDESMERTGVAHLAHRPLSELSGGQRQRAYLAQALASRADLLVLDEPTAGIDVAGLAVYRRAVDEERERGAGVVVATHDLADAERADHVLLLAGKVVASGPPASVLTTENLLDAFGVSLRSVGGRLIELEHPHGHDDEHPHG